MGLLAIGVTRLVKESKHLNRHFDSPDFFFEVTKHSTIYIIYINDHCYLECLLPIIEILVAIIMRVRERAAYLESFTI